MEIMRGIKKNVTVLRVLLLSHVHKSSAMKKNFNMKHVHHRTYENREEWAWQTAASESTTFNLLQY